MKKTLAIVLALAMALSMFASMAFVLNPGAGNLYGTPTDDALVITDFFVTDDAAMKAGLAVTTPLVDNTDGALYIAKNEIIRLALTFDVLNPAVINNAVKPITEGAPLNVDFTSKTVDLSLSQYPGMVALRSPYAIGGLVDAVNTIVSGSKIKTATMGELTNGTGVYYESNPISPAYKTLSTSINLYNNNIYKAGDDNLFDGGVSVVCDFTHPDGKTIINKLSYAFIFSGITKGEITEQGAVKANMNFEGKESFYKLATDTVPNQVVVKTVNDRTYIIKKNNTFSPLHENILSDDAADIGKANYIDDYYYDLDRAAYRVFLLQKNSIVPSQWDIIPVAQLDTETVKYTNVFGAALKGKDVEGIGYSLGLVDITADNDPITGATANVTAATLDEAIEAARKLPVYGVVDANAKKAFKTILSDGTVNYVDGVNGKSVFDAAEMARFNTMLADLGLSTDINYTYKLTDDIFTAAGAYKDVLVAEYNMGAVAPLEAEDEADVQEGTPDEELGEVEDVIEEGDIVEDLPEDIIEDVEVPTTGDATASVVLAAAAILAAAALAFVMKKVRD